MFTRWSDCAIPHSPGEWGGARILTCAGRAHYITDDLRPFYHDDEIAVLGVNTARSLTIKDGRINEAQIAWMSERLSACDPPVVKIVVTHHPFDVPDGHDERNLVGRARVAMEALARCGADVFLAGHLHVSHTSHSATRYKIKGHSALVVQAGTATSVRGRGEANAFNVLRIERPADRDRAFRVAAGARGVWSDDA